MIISDCYARYGGGIYCADSSSPYITDCQIVNNTAINKAGGIYALYGATPVIENSIIRDNKALEEGGGVMFRSAGYTVLKNCLLYGNSGSRGCAMVVYDTDVDAVNCTFVNNTGDEAAIYVWSLNFPLITSLHVKNGIISHNEASETVITYSMDTAITLFTFTDISNNTGGNWTGVIQGQLGLYGNICEDPLYVNLTAKDFHLTEGSPCIDAGDPLSPLDPDSTITDMGAYYYDQLVTGINIVRMNFTDERIYPNPFTSSTTLSYTLERPENVQITFYNLQGRVVERFEMEQPNGPQQIQWNAEGLPVGMYYFRIQAGFKAGSGKLIKMK